jgi:hypothetical protein
MTEDPTDAIDRLAAELDGIDRRESGGAVEFARARVVFAVREGAHLSFRMRPEIVAAALHTPGTTKSSRGPEWVTLASISADDYALDRATAWFEAAWRFAGEAAEPRPLVN